MDIYNLTKIASTMDDVRGALFYGFNIVGVHGRPLVGFSFETQADAEAAHKAMLAIVAKAKVITPHRQPGS
jgi:hypothetical protein